MLFPHAKTKIGIVNPTVKRTCTKCIYSFRMPPAAAIMKTPFDVKGGGKAESSRGGPGQRSLSRQAAPGDTDSECGTSLEQSHRASVRLTSSY
jgi:hypothetical protein